MSDPKDQTPTQKANYDEGTETTDQAEGERTEGEKQTKVDRNPDQAEGEDDPEKDGDQADPAGHS